MAHVVTHPTFSFQWPLFCPGRAPPCLSKKPSVRKQSHREASRIQREREQRYQRNAATERRRRNVRTWIRVGPRNPPLYFCPLLPRHAATTPFSFFALKRMPSYFLKRMAVLQQKPESPFAKEERPIARAKRIALEKKWAGGGPTFYEKLAADLLKDHEKEMWLRLRFRTCLTLWRYKYYARRAHAEGPPVDPVTMDPIRIPVEIVDYKAKRLFVFEAAALNQIVRQALLFQQYTLPAPQSPKNPYTNVPFTFSQLIGLYRQLVEKGCASHEFHMLRMYGFCLSRFKMYMEPWLQLQAQRQELYDICSVDGQEMLADFMIGCLEDLDRLSEVGLEDLVRDAVEFFPAHALLDRMRKLCMDNLEREMFGLGTRRAILLRFHAAFKSRSDLWLRVREKREELNRAFHDTEADEED
jgi:hypothetical protein